MTTLFLSKKNRLWVLAFVLLVAAYAPARASLIRDKGIYLAGPFEIPDIHQPPSASDEAVFLAGSTERAPWFLNELIIASELAGGEFSNNGWVHGSLFNATVINGGNAVWVSWDLSGTAYAMTYISVNFDNNFYHVYQSNPLTRSEGQILVTGNLRDAISHIHFFGVSTVPESGTTAIMFAISLGGIVLARRCLA